MTSMTSGTSRIVPQYRLTQPTERRAVGNRSDSTAQHQKRLIIVMGSLGVVSG